MKAVICLAGILLILLTGCEDVIDVETPTEEPRLVVDGLIRVDESESFLPVEIKVSLTDNFFGEVPVTSLENILIIYEEYDEGQLANIGTSTLAEIEPGTGIYRPDPTFMDDQRIPTVVTLRDEVIFNLLITHNGRRYFAETSYVPTVPLISALQGRGKLFSDDDTEVIVTFTDDPMSENYYVFDFDFDEFLVTEDEFYQGQLFQFSYFYDRQFDSGTEIEVSILGADPNFYNYMDLLIEQSEETQGIFQTPVATVRGNVFDVTGIDNIDLSDNVERPDEFPLGYFAVVQEFTQTLTIR